MVIYEIMSSSKHLQRDSLGENYVDAVRIQETKSIAGERAAAHLEPGHIAELNNSSQQGVDESDGSTGKSFRVF